MQIIRRSPPIAALALAFLVTAAPSHATAQAAPANPTNPVAEIETSMGTITAELFQEEAPRSVANFIDYARADFYAGTIFHRVIQNFMIQGGGLDAEMNRKQTRPPIPNEATNGLKNVRGTLAMARTAEVNSATAQFFINTVDNAGLDHRGMAPPEFGYAVFGRVIDGMDVVNAIAAVQTATRGQAQNVPVEPIVIKAVRIRTP